VEKNERKQERENKDVQGMMDGERKEREEREKKQEERMKRIEEKVQGGVLEAGSEEMIRKLEEEAEKGEKEWEKESRRIKDRMRSLKIASCLEKEERRVEERKREHDKLMKEIKESEKEMERRIDGAMEQLKLLNLDFGRECESKRELAKDAMMIVKDSIALKDRKEWDWIMKRTRVYILGNGSKPIKKEGRCIFTVPVLLKCSGVGDKERLAGINVSFQWPKEMVDYVKGVREEVEKLGFSKQKYFVRVRPIRKEDETVVRAEIKKKEGGQFKVVAQWKIPPRDCRLRDAGADVMKPSWTAGGS
jgi:hypothetical protein